MRGSNSVRFKPVACLVAVAVAFSGLSGCYLPEAGVLTGHGAKRELFYAVVRGVQCEIRKAIYYEVEKSEDKAKVQWLRNWSALMHFTFTFDTNVGFNPGVSFKTPNLLDATVSLADGSTRAAPQDYSFGLGGGFSAGTVRTEDVQFFYPFNKDFFANAAQDGDRQCYRLGGFTIGGDLALHDWIDDVLAPIKRCAFIGVPASAPATNILGFNAGSEDDQWKNNCPPDYVNKLGYSKDNPIKTFSHEVTFVLRLAASATPTWNLVRIATTSSPLFEGKREDTFDLKITLGSPDTDAPISRREKGDRVNVVRTRALGPSREMLDRDLALQIGAAVRDSLRQ